MNKKGSILAVVGAQYGSEGKGVIVHHLADAYDIHVRTGGPNAGHSFSHGGVTHKMQVIPCGWSNPNATLILGRGMLINPVILAKEIEYVEQFDPDIRSRLFVDPKAGVLDPKFHEQEGGTAGELHQRIGSTGEGVGAARVARINRDKSSFCHFGDIAVDYEMTDLLLPNTPGFLRGAVQDGANILLEGTQGSGLSLIHGPWPYVTSHDTNAAQMAADAGISPRLISQVVLVARTLPIRVAGNSGPLKDELSWNEVSERVGKSVEERTTVTKKIRRIGEWDEDLMSAAVTLNHPTSIAITFLDYISPIDEGKTDYDDLSPVGRKWVEYVASRWSTPVSLIGTGGKGWRVVETGAAV